MVIFNYIFLVKPVNQTKDSPKETKDSPQSNGMLDEETLVANRLKFAQKMKKKDKP